MKQEIYFDEMVLGSAVWDNDVLEKSNPKAWCGTPMIIAWEERRDDLMNGMWKDEDEKMKLIEKIKIEMRELPEEEYYLSRGGDGFDREEY